MLPSVLGLRDLGPGQLMVNTAVVEQFLNDTHTLLSRGKLARYTPVLRAGWLELLCKVAAVPLTARPHTLSSAFLSSWDTQDVGPHQLLPVGPIGTAPQRAASLCIIRSIILLPTITVIAWCHF